MSAAHCTDSSSRITSLYGLLALLFLATIAVSILVNFFFGQSPEEQLDTCSDKPSSPSVGEQDQVQTNPPDQPYQEDDDDDDRTSPISRRNKLVTGMIPALLVVSVFLAYTLVRYEQLMLDAYNSKLSTGIVLGSALVLLTLKSVYTTAKLPEIFAAVVAYASIPVSGPVCIKRQMYRRKRANGLIDTLSSLLCFTSRVVRRHWLLCNSVFLRSGYTPSDISPLERWRILADNVGFYLIFEDLPGALESVVF